MDVSRNEDLESIVIIPKNSQRYSVNLISDNSGSRHTSTLHSTVHHLDVIFIIIIIYQLNILSHINYSQCALRGHG